MSTRKNLRNFEALLERKGLKLNQVITGKPGHVKVEVSKGSQIVVLPFASSPSNDDSSVKACVKLVERIFKQRENAAQA